MLCNDIKREGANPSPGLVSGLSYYVPLHNIRYGIQDNTETHCEGRGTVAQITKNGAVKLKPQYSSKILNLSISDFFGPNNYKKTIPLNDLFQTPSPSSNSSLDTSDSALQIQIPVSFSLYSQGETYPDDKYWGGAGVSIT
jgi:hypothetical protein